MPLTVLQHPVAAHWVAELRDSRTPPGRFRRLASRLTSFLVVEATRDLPSAPRKVETPLETTEGRVVHPVVAVAILRAGLGMLRPLEELLPEVAVGFVGMERDETTAEARRYYEKLPPLEGRRVFVVDPMLATGGSAGQVIAELRRRGADDLHLLCIVAAPEGVQALEDLCPGIRITTAALDRELDERKYILPGLGDFGDRLYGT